MTLRLWPFQADIFERTRQALRRVRRVGIVMPTGSGKTAVAGALALRARDRLAETTGNALFLVHRRELLEQTRRTFDAIGLGDETGLIAAGKAPKHWQPIQISSIPTIVRRLEKMTHLDPRIIFVDEGHHATAATWARVVNRWPRALCVFLTATPMRSDDKGLGDMIDELVTGPQISDLAPEYLAPVDTYAVDPEFQCRARTLKAQAAYQTAAVVGKTVETWARLAGDKKTLFFAVDIAHSRRIVEQLRERGVSAAHVDYKTPDSERDAMFRRMRSGGIQCVSNQSLFTEGTDWPECECVVLARFTGSFPLYRQMNGRMMRRKKNGGRGTLIDMAGNIHVHGLPDDDVEWELEYGADKKERKARASNVRVCENCGFVHAVAAPECPMCGRRPALKPTLEIDADVTKQDAPRRRIRPTRRRLSHEIRASGGDLGKLAAIRRKYGYKQGWEERMLKIYAFAWRK